MRLLNRSLLVGLLIFAGALALGLYVAGPEVCRSRELSAFFEVTRGCPPPRGMGNSFTALIYFSAIALGLIGAMLVERLFAPRDALAGTLAKAPATETAAPSAAPAAAPTVAAVAAAAATPTLTPEAVVAEAESVAVPSEANLDPKPLAEIPRPVPVQVSADDDAEFLRKVWELDKVDASASVPLAERLVDENALAALQRGDDPKMNLSKLAQIVLQQDPELKSTVMRAIIVQVALRLKELGVHVDEEAAGNAAPV